MGWTYSMESSWLSPVGRRRSSSVRATSETGLVWSSAGVSVTLAAAGISESSVGG